MWGAFFSYSKSVLVLFWIFFSSAENEYGLAQYGNKYRKKRFRLYHVLFTLSFAEQQQQQNKQHWIDYLLTNVVRCLLIVDSRGRPDRPNFELKSQTSQNELCQSQCVRRRPTIRVSIGKTGHITEYAYDMIWCVFLCVSVWVRCYFVLMYALCSMTIRAAGKIT